EQFTSTPDADGDGGDIQWNFEKFLVSPDGEVLARFRPSVQPEDEQVLAAIDAVMATDKVAVYAVVSVWADGEGGDVALASGVQLVRDGVASWGRAGAA
ncbi:MAG TPA: hypothetical protein VFQ80_04685, partial [Thermomicrobiales bacterium]|nr:hypothetical protein [Thermomicrobiales bacterium]